MPITKEEQLGSYSKKKRNRWFKLKQEADHLFTLLVLSRCKCEFCGQPAIEPFHIVSRRNFDLRWDLDNVKPSCRRCHDYWHNSGEGEKWLEDTREELYFYYLSHRADVCKKPSVFDLEDLIEDLRGQLINRVNSL